MPLPLNVWPAATMMVSCKLPPFFGGAVLLPPAPPLPAAGAPALPDVPPAAAVIPDAPPAALPALPLVAALPAVPAAPPMATGPAVPVGPAVAVVVDGLPAVAFAPALPLAVTPPRPPDADDLPPEDCCGAPVPAMVTPLPASPFGEEVEPGSEPQAA